MPVTHHTAVPGRRRFPPLLQGRSLAARLPGVAVGCALLAAGPVRAQMLDRVLPPDIAGVATEPDVTVASRSRPAYDSLGVRAGAFLIRSSATESVGYETNVLGTSTPRGSPLVQTGAELSAATDQSRVSASASLGVNDIRYTGQQSQSHTDWYAGLNGAYRFGRDVLALSFQHQNQSETLQDLGVSQNLTQALPFRTDDGRISYRTEFARTFLVPALELTNYDYDNVQNNGWLYRQDYRNRLIVQPSLTAGYELAPRRNVVVVVRDSLAQYSTPLAGSATRNYNDVTILGGIDYDLNGIVRVRALGGYQIRNFESSQLSTIQAPIVELSASLNVTGLTTVTASASRAIQDSSDVITAAVTETQARLRVDHEYSRNLLLFASAGLYLDEYPNSGTQRLYLASLGANYLMNRNLTLGGNYDFIRRDGGSLTNLDIAGTGQTLGGNYTDHRFLVQFKIRL